MNTNIPYKPAKSITVLPVSNGTAGKTMDLDVTPNTTAADLRKMIVDQCGGPANARLICNGRQLGLPDSKTLAEERVGDKFQVTRLVRDYSRRD